MSVDQTVQVRREGSLGFVTKLARWWRAWLVGVLVVVFLLIMLEARIFHTSKLLSCVGVLLLVCMFISAIMLLVVGYLVPPPEPLTARHSLLNRLYQYYRVVLSAVMFGVAAFWGAIVSIDVGNASKSSGISGVWSVGWTAVLYPAAIVAILGVWVVAMGVFIDVCRTDFELVTSRFEAVLEKCIGLEEGHFRGWQRGHKAVRAFLRCTTRSPWAGFVVYFFPLLVMLALMLFEGWIVNYFSSFVR